VSHSNLGKNEALRHRNQVIILLLLNLGLRPSELLKLKVEDVVIGAISSVNVQRRPDEPDDPRKRSPEVKRKGRVLPLSEPSLVKTIDRYICDWRPQLDDRHEAGTDFLILSRDGQPLSYPSLFDVFLDLRSSDSFLPDTFSPKTLRHVFSSQVQKSLRQMGLSEDKIRARLMYLRGDSSDRSQDTYLAENDREEAGRALAVHQKSLFGELNLRDEAQV
jgi:integrase